MSTTYPAGSNAAGGHSTVGVAVDHTRDQSPAVKRVSWSAILAGVVVALSLQLLLSMLGVEIGLGTVDPATAELRVLPPSAWVPACGGSSAR